MKKIRPLIIGCMIFWGSLSCSGQATQWSEQDYVEISERLSSDLLNSQKLRDYSEKLGRKPNVSVGLIRSEADNTVDLNELIRRFEYKIFNSNTVEIIESADFRDEVRKERATQSEFEKEQAFKKWGKEAGANLILFGDLTVKTETRGNKNFYYYTVSLFMTDIETNTRIWFDQEQVKKWQKIEFTEPTRFDSRTPQLGAPQSKNNRDHGSIQKYIGLDFNRIHPIIFGNLQPGFGVSLFKERSIRGASNIIFTGWSLEYFQFGATNISLGSGSFNSPDPQSPFYGANNYSGSYTTNDKLFSLKPYMNFRVSGRRLSFYTALEAGLVLFSSKNKAQLNIQSQTNTSKTVVESDKNSSSITMTYGFKMGMGYRMSPRLDAAASAGFTFGLIPPLQKVTPWVNNSSSSVAVGWNKDFSFLYYYVLSVRVTYKLR
jgi:hypothetical protein